MSKAMEYWNKYFAKENEGALIQKFYDALKLSWSEETAYPSDAKNWTSENPSLGQCVVTSLIIQDELGGKIHKNSKFNHYWIELPTGRVVDLTKDQFNTHEKIVSEGNVSRKDLLEGERAAKVKTKERYNLLKRRFKQSLKQIKPTIFLLSSNAQAEYIQDVIEAIGLPEGSTHHFRYSLGYLDDSFSELIPVQGKKMPRFLKGAQVVVIYLNQTRRGPRDYLWNAILPVRFGSLKSCYKTSDRENATTHFFFELGQGVLPRDSFNTKFKRIFGKNYEHKYAHLAYCDMGSILDMDSPTRIFEDQCKKFQSAGFTYSDLEKPPEKQYDSPLMILIEGLYQKKLIFSDERLSPKYDNSTHKSYYNLTEATQYYIKYRTLCSEIKEPRQIRMKFPKESFSTPSEYIQNIHALYYSETWDIEPAYVEHGTRGFFEFETITVKNANSLPNELDCQISISFESRRRFLLRVLDTISDFLFVIGPTYLAATKIFENLNPKPWYINEWPMIVATIYVSWFVTKLLRNAIRGK